MLSTMYCVNITIDIMGMITTGLIVFSGMHDRQYGTKQVWTSAFFGMAGATFLLQFFDIFAWLFDGRRGWTFPILWLANFMIYALAYITADLLVHYLKECTVTPDPLLDSVQRIGDAMLVVAAAGLILSQFNGMYYSFDENGFYVRGPLYLLSQVYAVIIMLADVAIIMRQKSMQRGEKIALLSYGFLPLVAVVIQAMFYGLSLSYAAASISLMIVYMNVHARRGEKLLKLEAELAQSRVAVTISQIQPHFLYNSLASIAYLCEKDPKQARETTEEFAAYLRANLDAMSVQAPIPFSEEMHHVETYLKLEKRRFAERLNIVYDIQTTSFEIPALSVQPMAENAVRRGICVKEDGGTLIIRSSETDKEFIVIIEDDGVGFDVNAPMDTSRSHVGLQNVRSRIESMVGGSMTIESTLGVGTRVTLRIPRNAK